MEDLKKLERARQALKAAGKLPYIAKDDTPMKKIWAPLDPRDLPAAVSKPAEAPSLKTETMARILSKDYGLTSAMVTGTLTGPTVTTYLVELQRGTKARNIQAREEDLARDLGLQSVRILSRVPGHPGCLGVEVPNKTRGVITYKDVALATTQAKGHLPVVLGASSLGRPISLDLATMPHLLVAGTTGSGKSVMLHSTICSLISRLSPDQLHMYLVDPKRVEFQEYQDVAHVREMTYDQEESLGMLQGMVKKMEMRFKLFERAGEKLGVSVKNIQEFNETEFVTAHPENQLPYTVVVIDEYSDLMMAGSLGPDVKAAIIRLAQKARATGIHLVIATQKPTADVVDKQIKANLPSRLAFRVACGTDSRVIIDRNGADALTGKGDMLISTETIPLTRAQGAWLDAETIKYITEHSRG
jgi:S-DNA-T family DNA segregation ATPase FtsK/SpoIIIE